MEKHDAASEESMSQSARRFEVKGPGHGWKVDGNDGVEQLQLRQPRADREWEEL